MTLPPLTGDVARQLGQTAEALLSPLRWPSLDAWWREVQSRMQALVPGSHAMLTIFDGERPRHLSEGMDPSWMRHLTQFITVEPDGHMSIQCEATDAWLRYRRRTRQRVWGEATNFRDLDALGFERQDAIWYNDGLVPAGLKGYVCATSEMQAQEAVLCWSVDRRDRWSVEQAQGMALLEVLHPALQAGHHAFASLGARQAAVVATLDGVADALLVVGPDGREQHRNAALQRMLAAEPERERVLGALRDAARTLADGATTPIALLLASTRAAAGEAQVVTAQARYTVRATYGHEALWGRPGMVLATLERVAAAPSAGPPPTSDGATAGLPMRDLSALGMTAREIEVAQLLARRLTNRELAAALGVSAHTARHHTERVMQKLGVGSRRGVVGAVMGERSAISDQR